MLHALGRSEPCLSVAVSDESLTRSSLGVHFFFFFFVFLYSLSCFLRCFLPSYFPSFQLLGTSLPSTSSLLMAPCSHSLSPCNKVLLIQELQDLIRSKLLFRDLKTCTLVCRHWNRYSILPLQAQTLSPPRTNHHVAFFLRFSLLVYSTRSYGQEWNYMSTTEANEPSSGATATTSSRSTLFMQTKRRSGSSESSALTSKCYPWRWTTVQPGSTTTTWTASSLACPTSPPSRFALMPSSSARPCSTASRV